MIKGLCWQTSVYRETIRRHKLLSTLVLILTMVLIILVERVYILTLEFS